MKKKKKKKLHSSEEWKKIATGGGGGGGGEITRPKLPCPPWKSNGAPLSTITSKIILKWITLTHMTCSTSRLYFKNQLSIETLQYLKYLYGNQEIWLVSLN